MKVLRFLAVPAAILVTVLGGAACGTHHLAQKISCGSTVVSWYEKGGKADLAGLKSALKGVAVADEKFAKQQHHTTAELTPITTASGTLQTAITALGRDLPPACVPGAQGDIKAGLADFSQGVTAENQLVKAVQAKDATAAQAAGQKGSADFKSGGLKFLAAVTALRKYVAA